MLTLVIDCGIILLLLGTLVYMVLLNKRLNIIHSNRIDIEKLLETFSATLAKAELSLSNLQAKSQKFEKNIQEKIRTGTSLTDDLVFFIDRGESLATDLEKEVRKARDLKQEIIEQEGRDHKSIKTPPLKEERTPKSISRLKEPVVLQKVAGLH